MGFINRPKPQEATTRSRLFPRRDRKAEVIQEAFTGVANVFDRDLGDQTMTGHDVARVLRETGVAMARRSG